MSILCSIKTFRPAPYPEGDHLIFISKIFGAGLDPPARRRVGNYFCETKLHFPRNRLVVHRH